jgi:hypothetical protein
VVSEPSTTLPVGSTAGLMDGLVEPGGLVPTIEVGAMSDAGGESPSRSRRVHPTAASSSATPTTAVTTCVRRSPVLIIDPPSTCRRDGKATDVGSPRR